MPWPMISAFLDLVNILTELPRRTLLTYSLWIKPDVLLRDLEARISSFYADVDQTNPSICFYQTFYVSTGIVR